MRSVIVAAAAGLILTAAPATADPASADPAPTDPTLVVPAPQIPVAAPPGSSPDPLAPIALLMPQNFGMPTGDEPSPYALGENAPSPFARIDAFQGTHALLHSAFGRLPGEQLGHPLPGTAPPPGTALPPGLAQYVPAPPPADPLLLGVPVPN